MQTGKAIFVSYRNLDRGLARLLCDVIESAGAKAVIDETLDGDEGSDTTMQRRLRQTIEQVDLLVALITKRTRGGWWVPYEIGLALASGKPVVLLCAPSVRHPDFEPTFVVGDVVGLRRWIEVALPGAKPEVSATFEQALYGQKRIDLPAMSERAISALDELFAEGVERGFALENDDYADDKEFWLGCRAPNLIDTLYDFTAPIFLIERRGELLDASELEREFGGLLYKSWIDDQSIAGQEPHIDYAARKDKQWPLLRKQNPAKYWLQGMRIDDVASYFQTMENEHGGLISREAFTERFHSLYQGAGPLQKPVGLACNALQGWVLEERPVFARVAAIQILLHSALIKLAETGGVLKQGLPQLLSRVGAVHLPRSSEEMARAFILEQYSYRARTFDAS